MTPANFFRYVVEPNLQWMATGSGIAIPVNDEARVLVMTIAGQESRWMHRRQMGGPARGYWQFEQGGGVAGVLNHPASSRQARVVCGTEDIPSDIATVYEAIAWHDRLACVFARLLLWTDAAALPAVGDKDAAWEYYIRCWRPGVPHRESWNDLYDQSLAAMRA